MDSKIVYEVISNIEIKIKKVIKDDVLNGQPKAKTYQKIKKIINDDSSQLPIQYRNDIAKNCFKSADSLYNDYLNQTNQWFYMALTLMLSLNLKLFGKSILQNEIKTKSQLYNCIIENPRHAFDGYPFLNDYKKSIQRRTLELAKKPLLSQEEGHRKTSLFAKAEIQIRYENQMNMINNLKKKGVKLVWISSHVDCSDRCKEWQGKLVDLNAPAINNRFETGEVVDGHKVYSFEAITNVVDKYGYKNNIIVGFNCRHHLIPYKANSKSPHSYRSKKLKEEFKINTQLRTMERTIRDSRKQAMLIKDLDSKKYKELKKRIQLQVNVYKEFAKNHNVEPLLWRTNISKGEKLQIK